MSEALLDNKLLTMNDFGKIARHQTLHLAFQALHGFVKKEQQLPRLRSQVGQGSRMLQPTFIHSFHKTSCPVKKKKKNKKNLSLPLQPDAETLLGMVQKLNAVAQLEELDEAAVRRLSFTARGDLAPINAFIGGLAAQEVIKVRANACNARLHPSFSL